MNMEMRDAVAGAEALPWWFLRLPGPLESSFETQTAAERNRQIRFWIIVSVAFYWLCFGLEFVAVPDRIWLSMLVRLGFMAPLAGLSVLLLRKMPPGWDESVVAILSPTLNTVAQLCIFASSARVDTLLDTLVLALEVLWMNVLFPFRLREAALFSIITMGVGDAINAWSAAAHHAVIEYPHVIIAAHGIVALSVLGRAVAEQNLRRSFLQGLSLHFRVEDLSRANDKLLELSNTDPLTGVANRRYFDCVFDRAWQESAESGGLVALMMIDVDYFKLFNDTAGHLEGDRCLATIARIISQQVRSRQDLVSRFGGEEFVVLMPDTDLEAAEEVAQRIRAAIDAQRVFHPAKAAGGFVSVSIGVATTRLGRGINTQAGLIAEADRAMYAAKAGGRNQVALAHA